jgi:hypothetical protein
LVNFLDLVHPPPISNLEISEGEILNIQRTNQQLEICSQISCKLIPSCKRPHFTQRGLQVDPVALANENKNPNPRQQLAVACAWKQGCSTWADATGTPIFEVHTPRLSLIINSFERLKPTYRFLRDTNRSSKLLS